MRSKIILAMSSFVILLSAAVNSQATFIQPTSASTTASPSLNTPAVLINAATGNGGTSYVAPNPSSGGGGTSWHTGDNGTSPVRINFDFAATTDIFSELYMWDYYTHSPSDWTLKLYTGAGGTGTELLNFDFSIIPGPNLTSTKTAIDFTDVTGVLSGVLQTRNNSTNGGVGLAEFGFVTFAPPPPPAPEPSSLLLLGIGALGLVRRIQRARAQA
jgi:hypothetical protein